MVPAFNSKVKGVLLEIGTGPEGADRLITAEYAIAAALARQ